ncbi:MAG: hypothetical protein NTZ47_09105 [Bacteroidetes bacterium]|nr:hypothetical protein [Bacteroidota bacterium]
MFTTKRITIKGNDIYINKPGLFGQKTEEYLGVLSFDTSTPTIKVFENNILLKTFNIETLATNSNLAGQYFHISVRLLENDGVMIDGVISKQKDKHPDWQDSDYEAIRFQPFFLSTADVATSQRIIGKGVFERGLHYSGTVTPTTVRVICICDNCDKSFTVQHFHGGFSESQYYYSEDSKQTLTVPYDKIKNLPTHLQKEVDEKIIAEVEAELPKPTKGKGSYRYYNSFCCPHCLSPYTDFQKNKQIRQTEYYGLKYINDKFYTLDEH